MNLHDIEEASSFLSSKGIKQPVVGIVLGTGLNHLVSYIEDPVVIKYSSIPHFPSATVEFHKGKLIFGSIEGVDLMVMQGRFHYYEGYSMQQITLPVRVMKALGVQYLLLSNAAGGLDPDFRKGDIVITEDHINMLPENPLRGLDESWGNRFVDLSEPYNKEFNYLIEQAFTDHSVPVKKGVYVAVMGPNLETKAEYRWLRSTGADMVGMSTVPEVIVANHIGLKAAAVSIITDECDPDNLQKVDISELLQTAALADKKLSAIIMSLLKRLHKNIKTG